MTTSPRTVLFVTGNANKLKEVRSILLAATQDPSKGDAAATPSFSVESEDLDVPEVQGTTQEVAMAKVRAAAEIVGGPCITEVGLPWSCGADVPGALSGRSSRPKYAEPSRSHRILPSALKRSEVCPVLTSSTL